MKTLKFFRQRILFLYLMAIIFIDPCSCAKRKYVDMAMPYQGVSSSQESLLTPPKKRVKIANPLIFEPIEMNFPDITRTGQEAIDYANELKKNCSPSGMDSNLIMTGESCSRGLGNIYIVIRIDEETKQEFLLYSVCFIEETGSLMFSSHKLEIIGKIMEHSRHRGFKPRYSLYNENVNGYYKAKKHTEVFNGIFHDPITNADRKLTYYFARNHATPHADFALIVDQKLTYFFHNCIPGYQSVNAVNIAHVEVIVRQLSIRLGVPLIIYTGVYGILQKWNRDKSKLLDVYLDMDGKRFPVPRVIWKLAYNEVTGESISFFTSNDVNLTEDEIKHFRTICENDKCADLGFKFNPDVKYGITVCCSYQDFVKHIRFLPVTLPIDSGLLGATTSANSKVTSQPIQILVQSIVQTQIVQTVVKTPTSVKKLVSKTKKLKLASKTKTTNPNTPVMVIPQKYTLTQPSQGITVN